MVVARPEGKPVTIAMVAGEASGDSLGAGLMAALREDYPDARFVGIGGPAMVAAGFHSLVPMERLSVMGLTEVVRHLPELLAIRRRLLAYCHANRPDLFIGIDSPDFNLPLGRRLKRKGLKTAHYVSPSVWAWRQGRVRSIARAVDRMLTLFPFEARFYEQAGVPVRYVGHPLADRMPLEPDRAGARRALGLDGEGLWLALLPGSRRAEVERLGPVFLQTAAWLRRRFPRLGFVAACANEARRREFQRQMEALPDAPPVRLVIGRGREVMTAADGVLLASGTATLEAMLAKRPMVVAYQLAPLTWWLVSKMVKISHVALPNLLTRKPLVPELLQGEATPEQLGQALAAWLKQPDAVKNLQRNFLEVHQNLRCDADRQAAEAIRDLLTEKRDADR